MMGLTGDGLACIAPFVARPLPLARYAFCASFLGHRVPHDGPATRGATWIEEKARKRATTRGGRRRSVDCNPARPP